MKGNACFSVPEVAKELGISTPKAYDVVKAPNFPKIYIGSRIIIPKEEFSKWLAREANKPFDER
ncbi:helix-turn-helix domain-containing protein [Eubacterium aggregans]|uniref:helix-turn-helix domain-containing protein n=1 Tax=Eubacterium aggregans TaxID=81409 RepID=UPI003F3EB7F8